MGTADCKISANVQPDVDPRLMDKDSYAEEIKVLHSPKQPTRIFLLVPTQFAGTAVCYLNY